MRIYRLPEGGPCARAQVSHASSLTWASASASPALLVACAAAASDASELELELASLASLASPVGAAASPSASLPELELLEPPASPSASAPPCPALRDREKDGATLGCATLDAATGCGDRGVGPGAHRDAILKQRAVVHKLDPLRSVNLR